MHQHQHGDGDGIIAASVFGALIVLLVLLLTATGCAGYVKVDAVQPAYRKVRLRHDAYIKSDPGLDEEEKEAYLGTSRMVDETFDAAR